MMLANCPTQGEDVADTPMRILDPRRRALPWRLWHLGRSFTLPNLSAIVPPVNLNLSTCHSRHLRNTRFCHDNYHSTEF